LWCCAEYECAYCWEGDCWGWWGGDVFVSHSRFTQHCSGGSNTDDEILMNRGNLNIISINTTMRERSTYMGGVGVVWGAGTILGPVIGGSFADSKATWRWVRSTEIPKN
jgi:hypothetical protein